MPGTKLTSPKPSAKQLQAIVQQKVREAITQLRLDGDYPATLSGIADRTGTTVENTSKLLNSKGLKEQVVQRAVTDTSLVVFKDDTDRLATDARVLIFFASNVLAKRQTEGKPLRADLKKFISDAKVPANLKAAFKQVIEDRFKQNDLPQAIAELLMPPTASSHQIATRLFDVLTSQRHASTNSYPVSLNRLFELAEFAELSTAARTKAIKDTAFADRVAYCGSRPGDASNSKSCILKSDLSPLLPQLAQAAFDYAVASSSSPKKNKQSAKTAAVAGTTTIFPVTALGEAMLVVKVDQDLFVAQFAALVNRSEAELAIGWLEIKGAQHYFRLADVHFVGAKRIADAPLSPVTLQHPIVSQPGAAPQFAADFDAAFRRIDARGGNRNFVKVYDLRDELSQYDRAAFDAGLRRLREAKQYAMDSAQGGYVPLSEAERRSGIQEGSSLLVYVTRKT